MLARQSPGAETFSGHVGIPTAGLLCLLDDADELARLREGLKDKAATWHGTVSAMQERIDRTDEKYEEHLGYRHALEDCADEVEALLSNGNDNERD